MKRALSIAVLGAACVASIATSKIDPFEWQVTGELSQDLVFDEEIETAAFHVETSGELDPQATGGFLTVEVRVDSAELITDSEDEPNPLDVVVTLTRPEFEQENLVHIFPVDAAADTGFGDTGDFGADPGTTILFDIPECDDIEACLVAYELEFDLDRPLAEGESVELTWTAIGAATGSGETDIPDPGIVIEVTIPEEE